MRRALKPGAKLSRKKVVRLAEDARGAGHELDLSECDLSGVNLGVEGDEEIEWRDVIFGRHKGPPPANLQGTNFRGATLEDCRFAHANLTGADFRGCYITGCDMRYATFRRMTLGDATLVRCDLYRAILEEGTVMRNTVLELVSMTTDLDGAVDLRWDSFTEHNGHPALVLEDENEYRKFLEPTKEDRPPNYTIDDAIADRFSDAARLYRRVSGVFTNRGEFRDAGLAYAHSRRLERQGLGPRHLGWRFFRRNPFAWLWLWGADLLCGFGEKLGRIVPWLVAVALLPGIAYWLFGGVKGGQGIGDDLLFSASQLTASTPSRLTSATQVVEWIGVVQTLSGIALLGLFGFVLGNKIRNS